jgi:ribonuclease T1
MLGLFSRFAVAALLLLVVTSPFNPQYATATDTGLLTRSHGQGAQGHRAELGWISADALPPDGRATLKLIKEGGPFPYPRDGIIFGNREGRLPDRPSGYYREYTVKTPGKRDRGARRIVAGKGGEFYYTDDHYKTFRQIKE